MKSVPSLSVTYAQKGTSAAANELGRNGYEVLKGKRLKDIKLSIQEADVPEIDFGNIKMTPQLGVFDFRAFLNLAMLIRESERADDESLKLKIFNAISNN